MIILLPDDKRSEILTKLLKSVILAPREIYDTHDGGYFLILDIILGLVALQLVFSMVWFTRMRRFFSETFALSWVCIYEPYFILLLSSLGFVQYVMIILEVFKCVESVGDHTYTDSYLDVDCY
jgi:hypothetical protein